MNQENNGSSQSFWTKFVDLINTSSAVAWIKSKTRTEWLGTFQELASSSYQKLTCSTEMALIVGFLAGIIAVLFLKAIFCLALIVFAVCALIWLIADEQRVLAKEENQDRTDLE